MWLHRAYGLTVGSSERIDGLTELSNELSELAPDLSIAFQDGPRLGDLLRSPWHVRYVSANDEGVPPHLVVRMCDGGRLYSVHYAEGIDFTFDLNGTRMWIRWDAGANAQNVRSYLLGPVMGLLLRVRNVVCLHASAVNLHGRAVVFVGSDCAGKSTTAMALGRRGYPILSDDIVPLYRTAAEFCAGSGYPTVRLRRSALEALGTVRSNLPELPTPLGAARLHFALTGEYQFQSDPLPLGRIYVLSARESDDRAPRVVELSGVAGVMALVANSYAARFLDRAMKREEMDWFAAIGERVPIFKLISHTDGDRLEQLCDLIVREAGCQARAAALGT